MFSWFTGLFTRKTTAQQWIADVAIAGLQHYRGNDLAEMISEGDTLQLQPQPSNAYDKNAIMVMWHNNKIGYVPASLARNIRRQMEAGFEVSANIIEIKPVKFGRKWIKIRLQTKTEI